MEIDSYDILYMEVPYYGNIYLQHSRTEVVARRLAPRLFVDERVGFHLPIYQNYLIDST